MSGMGEKIHLSGSFCWFQHVRDPAALVFCLWRCGTLTKLPPPLISFYLNMFPCLTTLELQKEFPANLSLLNQVSFLLQWAAIALEILLDGRHEPKSAGWEWGRGTLDRCYGPKAQGSEVQFCDLWEIWQNPRDSLSENLNFSSLS